MNVAAKGSNVVQKSMLILNTAGLRYRIPNLWSFFALAQILPISFTQNLLYLALLRARVNKSPRPEEATFPRNQLLALTTAYMLVLRLAPRSGQNILFVVAVARALLLVPYILAHAPKNANISSSQSARWSTREAGLLLGLLTAIATARQVYEVQQAGLSVNDVLSALTSHPAVTTLGVDMVISCFSWFCWQFAQYN
jgi:hypothetical protein